MEKKTPVSKPAKKAAVKKPTKAPVAEAQSPKDELEERREQMHKEMDELYDELSKPGYQNRGYSDEVITELEGSIFTSFINVNSENKRVLDAVQKNLIVAYNTIDTLLVKNAELSILLMKVHIKNINDGKTKDTSELIKSKS